MYIYSWIADCAAMTKTRKYLDQNVMHYKNLKNIQVDKKIKERNDKETGNQRGMALFCQREFPHIFRVQRMYKEDLIFICTCKSGDTFYLQF